LDGTLHNYPYDDSPQMHGLDKSDYIQIATWLSSTH